MKLSLRANMWMWVLLPLMIFGCVSSSVNGNDTSTRRADTHSTASERADVSVANVLAEYDLAGDCSYFLVPARVAGDDCFLAANTLSWPNSYDISTLPPTSMPQEGSAMSTLREDTTRIFAVPPDAHVGDWNLALCGKAGFEDLSGVRAAVGEDIRGILGMSFLGNFVVEFNPDDGKVRLLKHVNATTAGEPIPMHFAAEAGAVVINVRIGEDSELFAV